MLFAKIIDVCDPSLFHVALGRVTDLQQFEDYHEKLEKYVETEIQMREERMNDNNNSNNSNNNNNNSNSSSNNNNSNNNSSSSSNNKFININDVVIAKCSGIGGRWLKGVVEHSSGREKEVEVRFTSHNITELVTWKNILICPKHLQDQQLLTARLRYCCLKGFHMSNDNLVECSAEVTAYFKKWTEGKTLRVVAMEEVNGVTYIDLVVRCKDKSYSLHKLMSFKGYLKPSKDMKINKKPPPATGRKNSLTSETSSPVESETTTNPFSETAIDDICYLMKVNRNELRVMKECDNMTCDPSLCPPVEEMINDALDGRYRRENRYDKSVKKDNGHCSVRGRARIDRMSYRIPRIHNEIESANQHPEISTNHNQYKFHKPNESRSGRLYEDFNFELGKSYDQSSCTNNNNNNYNNNNNNNNKKNNNFNVSKFTQDGKERLQLVSCKRGTTNSTIHFSASRSYKEKSDAQLEEIFSDVKLPIEDKLLKILSSMGVSTKRISNNVEERKMKICLELLMRNFIKDASHKTLCLEFLGLLMVICNQPIPIWNVAFWNVYRIILQSGLGLQCEQLENLTNFMSEVYFYSQYWTVIRFRKPVIVDIILALKDMLKELESNRNDSEKSILAKSVCDFVSKVVVLNEEILYEDEMMELMKEMKHTLFYGSVHVKVKNALLLHFLKLGPEYGQYLKDTTEIELTPSIKKPATITSKETCKNYSSTPPLSPITSKNRYTRWPDAPIGKSPKTLVGISSHSSSGGHQCHDKSMGIFHHRDKSALANETLDLMNSKAPGSESETAIWENFYTEKFTKLEHSMDTNAEKIPSDIQQHPIPVDITALAEFKNDLQSSTFNDFCITNQETFNNITIRAEEKIEESMNGLSSDDDDDSVCEWNGNVLNKTKTPAIKRYGRDDARVVDFPCDETHGDNAGDKMYVKNPILNPNNHFDPPGVPGNGDQSFKSDPNNEGLRTAPYLLKKVKGNLNACTRKKKPRKSSKTQHSGL